ncbi:MAG: Fic family protein [Bacteroidia bacterium]|jgi:Fic family protein
MRPPYEITPDILKFIASISEKIGEVNAKYLNKQNPQLRKQNKIKTIHSSLQIEGNTLSQEQITALIENKRVIGPQKDILEVKNAIEVYENVSDFKSVSEKSFLSAHKILLSGLVQNAGSYRRKGVGIVKGSVIEHIVPPHENVPFLMRDLFAYLKSKDEIALIKSCVFHYEMEFIHPFIDGNGRMGRLWQSVILLEKYPVFEFLPFETLISKNQSKYYKVLSLCDKQGKSTLFIEFMLQIIDQSLEELLNYKGRILKDIDRIEYFMAGGENEFSRKDYMSLFKEISTATASRDLKKGIELGFFEKEGDKTKTMYRKRN